MGAFRYWCVCGLGFKTEAGRNRHRVRLGHPAEAATAAGTDRASASTPSSPGASLSSLVALEGVEAFRLDDKGERELAGLGVLPLLVEADAAPFLEVAQRRGRGRTRGGGGSARGGRRAGRRT